MMDYDICRTQTKNAASSVFKLTPSSIWNIHFKNICMSCLHPSFLLISAETMLIKEDPPQPFLENIKVKIAHLAT
jgi:hypothetical protein